MKYLELEGSMEKEQEDILENKLDYIRNQIANNGFHFTKYLC